jgi:hypothetical protein
VATISSTGARTFKKPVRAIVLRALFRLQRIGFFGTLIIATAQAQQTRLDVIVIGSSHYDRCLEEKSHRPA